MDENSQVQSAESAVIRDIQEAYLRGEIHKTGQCMDDMVRDDFREADVEKVLLEARTAERSMPAAHPATGTCYEIHGTSTKGIRISCTVCSNIHPLSGEFLRWRFRSFCMR